MDSADNKSSINIERIDRAHFLLVFFFLLPISGWGQGPFKVEVCDLVREPEKYSRQWIEVRAKVNIGFEDFTLDSNDCGEDLRQIWLAYGGDESTPVISTVNDHERKPGSIQKFEGIPVPLQRNAELELFKMRLEAERLESLAGDYCGSFCHLYNVTATFSGLFLAGGSSVPAGLDAYGHLGCCHLFVIQKVTGVEAVRTEVPAGGRFTCSTESWELDQATEAALEVRNCQGAADCRKARSEAFRIVAEHWQDKVDLYKGTAGSGEWISPDRLFAYKLVYADQKGEPLPQPMVQRTVCKATQPPYPPSTQIGCKSLHSDFNVSKKEITEAEHWTGDLEEISRAALKEAARQWGVPLMATLSPIQCEKPVMLEGDQSAWCQWSEPTAMQEFTIQISRSHFLRKGQEWNKVPWTLTGGTGTVCVAETK